MSCQECNGDCIMNTYCIAFIKGMVINYETETDIQGVLAFLQENRWLEHKGTYYRTEYVVSVKHLR